jgi:hypothetical protein
MFSAHPEQHDTPPVAENTDTCFAVETLLGFNKQSVLNQDIDRTLRGNLHRLCRKFSRKFVLLAGLDKVALEVKNGQKKQLLCDILESAESAYTCRKKDISKILISSMTMIDLKEDHNKTFSCPAFKKKEIGWNTLLEFIKENVPHDKREEILADNLAQACFIKSNLTPTYQQLPHIDFFWKDIISNAGIPWTAHIPLTADGSYLFVWSGPGDAIPIHIKYGEVLLIRGDTVHAGGLPTPAHYGKEYTRLHLYLPKNPGQIPTNKTEKNDWDGFLLADEYENSYSVYNNQYS